MRKIISWLLLGIGAFLFVTAILANFWLIDQVKVTPLDTDSTTRLSGTATALPTGEGNFDVRAVSITKADSKVSNDDVVVFLSYTCLVLAASESDCGEEGEGENADPNVVTVGVPSVFATDRNSGKAVNDAKYIGEDTEPTEGLVNKFPFDTEKKSYDFWDDVLGETVETTYVGTKKIEGVDTYEFNYQVSDVPAKISGDIDGEYSMDKTMWIDPRTGQIIAQEQHDQRALPTGAPVLDVQLAFTDDQVEANAKDALDNIRMLDLVGGTIPMLGFILGPLLMLGGAAMLFLNRGSAGRKKA